MSSGPWHRVPKPETAFTPVTLSRRESAFGDNETKLAGHANPMEHKMSIEQDAQDNLKYQRWLAESLVASLGYDKAVKVCLEMCWYGTWDFLMKEKDGYLAEVPDRSQTFVEAA